MKKSLNSNQLKLIAVLAMIFDHLLWVIKPGYNNGTIVLLLHLIGRIVAKIKVKENRNNHIYGIKYRKIRSECD